MMNAHKPPLNNALLLPRQEEAEEFPAGDSGLHPRLSNKLERYVVFIAFCVYLAFQINAALHHGSWGQDLLMHRDEIAAAAANPWKFVTQDNAKYPDPPLYYLIVAGIYTLTRTHWNELNALLWIAFNAFGFYLLYTRILRSLIDDSLLRLACLLFVLFLPALMIHATVLACDSPTVPMVIALEVLLFGLTDEQSPRSFWLRVAGIALLLAIGIETKLLFVSQALAALLSLWILCRTKLLQRQRAVQAAAVFAIVLLLGFALLYSRRDTIGFQIAGEHMSVRDVVFFHKADPHVLSAPPYLEPVPQSPHVAVAPDDLPYNLLIGHRFSYPALLHLALFTDILNIYQHRSAETEYGERSRTNLSRMRLAVKTGLIFFFTVLILAPVAICRSLYFSFVKRRSAWILPALLAISALGWYLNIVLFLPPNPSYPGGYWLPRLVTPALVFFVVLAITVIDRFVERRSVAWSVSILALVVLQSAVQLSFLWIKA